MVKVRLKSNTIHGLFILYGKYETNLDLEVNALALEYKSCRISQSLQATPIQIVLMLLDAV